MVQQQNPAGAATGVTFVSGLTSFIVQATPILYALMLLLSCVSAGFAIVWWIKRFRDGK